MPQGTIKNKVEEKGFGFIECAAYTKDIFFHATGCQGVKFAELQVGDEVEFSTEDGPKGPKAINVRLRSE